MKKKILSTFLALCMLLSLLPTAALAAVDQAGGPTAPDTLEVGVSQPESKAPVGELPTLMSTTISVDGTTKTLADAIGEAGNGDTIKLTGNIDLSNTGVTITDKSIILDLNGKEITYKVDRSEISAITLTDTASLEVKGTGGGRITVSGVGCNAIKNESSGTLTVSGGTISSEEAAINNAAGGAVKVTGGTISGASTAMYNGDTGTIEIAGGTVNISKPIDGAGVILNRSIGGIKISGGTVTANGTLSVCAIKNRESAATVEIVGGTVTANGTYGGAILSDGPVMMTGGTVEHIGEYSTAISGNGSIEMTGGTVKQSGENGIAIVSNGSITMSGGTVEHIGDYTKFDENFSENTGAIESYGEITISGDAKVISTGAGSSAITLSGEDNSNKLTLNGGLVEHTDSNGIAIKNKNSKATLVHNSGIVLGDCEETPDGMAWSAKGTVTLAHDTTIPAGKTFTVHAGAVFNISGGVTLTNNGTLVLPDSVDSSEAIAALKLAGDGIVNVGEKHYTNAGKLMHAYQRPMDFTVSAENGNWSADATLETNGYIWDAKGKVLTLSDFALDTTASEESSLTLPSGATLRLAEGTKNLILSSETCIYVNGDLTMDGTGELRTNHEIYTDTLTMQEGSYQVPTLFASCIILTGTAVVHVDDINNIEIKDEEILASVSVSGNAELTVTCMIMTESYTQNGGKATILGDFTGVEEITFPEVALVTNTNCTLTGGSFSAKGSDAALLCNNELTIGSGLSILTPAGGKVLSTEIESPSGKMTYFSVVPADVTELTFDYGEAGMKTNAAKAVSIATPAPTPGGGGSSSGGGGGSSSGGGSSIITPPTTPENPNPPTTAETEVTGKTDSNGKAAATVADKDITNAIDQAQKEAKKNGTEKNGIALVVDVKTDKNATSLETTLSKASIDAQLKAGVTSLTVQNGLSTVTLDLAALKALAGGGVKLSVNQVDPKSLSAEAQSAIGDRPVFQYGATVGGKAVTDFQGGSVGLQMPYTPGSTEQAEGLCGVFVDSTGKVIWMENSSYDPKTGMLLASTPHFSVFGVGYKQNTPKFIDTVNHWAKDNIDFVVARGLFSGTTDTTFSPDQSMTRGMFVTVLGRLAGVDTKQYENTKFTDVKADAYYAPYVAWANESGIVNGTTATTFGPDSAITRQAMAVMLANYAKAMSHTLPSVHAEVTFADAGSIASWAKDAVKQMQLAGILTGKSEGKFAPTATATRAEVATMLHRFVALAQ